MRLFIAIKSNKRSRTVNYAFDAIPILRWGWYNDREHVVGLFILFSFLIEVHVNKLYKEEKIFLCGTKKEIFSY